jgi:hypothetical protein
MAEDSSDVRASREVRLAIEIVTAMLPMLWTPGPALRRQAQEHVHRVRQDAGPDTIFAGQLTLTMLLLKDLAEQRGASDETLMGEMSAILQEVARKLPA